MMSSLPKKLQAGSSRDDQRERGKARSRAAMAATGREPVECLRIKIVQSPGADNPSPRHVHIYPKRGCFATRLWR